MTAQQPLLDLCRTREIVHPTSVKSFELLENTATMQVLGYPWWDPENPPDTEAELSISFPNISDLHVTGDFFAGDPFQEALEEFEIYKLSEVAWYAGEEAEVFLYEPMTNPMEFLANFELTLRDHGCEDNMASYLEQVGGIANLKSLLSKELFLLGRFSGDILLWVVEELKRLGVKHSTVDTGSAANRRERLETLTRVRFVGFDVTCETPTAFWSRP